MADLVELTARIGVDYLKDGKPAFAPANSTFEVDSDTADELVASNAAFADGEDDAPAPKSGKKPARRNAKKTADKPAVQTPVTAAAEAGDDEDDMDG